MMDPEDVKSLDSAEGVALAEEQSENNSSNSDIVHVEREDAELLEEAGETVEEGGLQSSVLSVLGSESELAAVREQESAAPELLAEPVVMEIPPPPSPPPPPPSSALAEQELPPVHAAVTASIPVPEPKLQSQPVPAPVEPPPSSPPEPEATLEQEILSEVELKTSSRSPDLPIPSPAEVQTTSVPQAESAELPVLLYGGAALVAVAAVLAFGALAYRKK